MQAFQKAVLIAAIIILIIVLTLIGFALNQGKKGRWPPLIGDCPDYWVDLSGNGQKCVNKMNLGNGTCRPARSDKFLTMDFTQPAFSGGNGLCAKYKWANNCGVSWDGITYGVDNPCNAAGVSLTSGVPGSCPGSGVDALVSSSTSLSSSASGMFSGIGSSIASSGYKLSQGISDIGQSSTYN